MITAIRIYVVAHGDPTDQLIRGIKHTWSEQINCDCTVVLRPAVAVTDARDIGAGRRTISLYVNDNSRCMSSHPEYRDIRGIPFD